MSRRKVVDILLCFICQNPGGICGLEPGKSLVGFNISGLLNYFRDCTSGAVALKDNVYESYLKGDMNFKRYSQRKPGYIQYVQCNTKREASLRVFLSFL